MNRRNALKRLLASGTTVLVLDELLTSKSLFAGNPQAILTFDLNDPRFAALKSVDGYMSISNTLAPGIQSVLQSNYPLAVVRNSPTEITAMEHFCTHMGTNIGSYDSTLKRFQCPQHGSRFNGKGIVQRGPATSDLKTYPASIAGSIVTVSGLSGNSNWNITSADILTAPSAFELQQNYPNPFTAQTNITFVLASRMHIYFSVFNSLGQEVALLLDRQMEQGMHTVSFDASALPSGVYFATLRAGGYTESKRMHLER